MTDVNESVKRKIYAILNLVHEGSTEGERQAAQVRLQALLDRYGLDLDDLQQDEVKVQWFGYRTTFEKRLLYQIRYFVTKRRSDPVYKYKGGKLEIGMPVTAVEGSEIRFLFDHYRKLLKEELEVFYYAFLDANDLLIPRTEDDPDITDEDVALANRARQVARGVRRESPHKRIGDGGE